MNWNHVSADRWEATVGDVSVRLQPETECNVRETWLTYIGETVVCRAGGYSSAQDAMRAAPCITKVGEAIGNACGEGRSMKDQSVVLLDPMKVKPFADQPRKRFRGIDKLTESIRLVGQITPILVTACEENGFLAELVDGERRLQACRTAKIPVKAIMQGSVGKAERFAASVAANFCRQGHDAMEVAGVIARFKEQGRSAEDIAGIFGKSTCWVYQHASLLQLCPEVQQMLTRAAEDEGNKHVRRPGRITLGLALLLLPLPHAKQATVAKRIVRLKMYFGQARAHILHVTSKAGVKPKRQQSPHNKLQVFWNALTRFRGDAERVVNLPHAALRAAMEGMSASQAKTLAGQIGDLCGDLIGLSDALEKRAKQ